MELNEALFKLVHKVRHNMIHQVKVLDPDLSPMHMKSLKFISKSTSCSGQEIASVMGRDKAQINRLVKELVNKDLVQKEKSEHDKRSQILTLSKKGKVLIEEFSRAEKQIFDKMLVGVSQSQISEFIETAVLLRRNL